MFMMFAMTTDSVGVIIPELIRTFHLGMAAAGAFQYASMAGIALAGLGLGFLADRLGRKATIIIGLSLFAATAFAILAGHGFAWFVTLIFLAGCAIGIFKTGALALIGNLCSGNREHTTTMNLVEGFFGVGAIIGPAIVASLIRNEVSWKWLYAIAGSLCVVLILMAICVRYPQSAPSADEPVNLRRTLRMMSNPFAVGFGTAIGLYVAVEASVYVWGPLYLASYRGEWLLLASYAIAIFFALRAAARFAGAWLLARFDWSAVVALMAQAIFLCLIASVAGGVRVAIVSLPLSGLFMAVIYPTLNSKAISCFRKSEHGAVAGVLLFFTCAGAVLGPLIMGAAIDLLGGAAYAFWLAALFAALLTAGLTYNWLRQPTREILARLNLQEYGSELQSSAAFANDQLGGQHL